MKPARELESGVLPTFLLFIGVQLAVSGLGVITQWLPPPIRSHSEIIAPSMFSLLEPGLLFLYLSIPVLRRWLKSFYLPFGIAWATAGPILDPYINLHPLGGNSLEVITQVRLWRQTILLLIPLVVVSWQYSIRRVLLFCLLTTGLNLALLSQTAALQAMNVRSLLGIVFAQVVILLLVGHMIVNLLKVQRQQRQRLTEANERLTQYASTLEQLTLSRERNRLARELHDTLAHSLSGVAVQLEGVDALWDTNADEARAMLKQSLANTRSGLTETRRALQASSRIACSIICRSSQVLPAAMIGTVEPRLSSR